VPDEKKPLSPLTKSGKCRWKSLFSYYGGKSKLVAYYPSPKHDLVIEPFAGGGSYSLYYRERDVILNDLDDVTCSIWRFLLRPDALDVFDATVDMTKLVAGARISETIDPNADPGLIRLLRAEANQGTMGGKSTWDQITKRGEKFFPRLRAKMDFFLPKIRHWKLIQGDYRVLPNEKATWFVDPPYSNNAGSLYRHGASGIDFAELKTWCGEREGQTIICENEGATWETFKPLRTRLGFKSSYQKSEAMEVYCEKNSEITESPEPLAASAGSDQEQSR
jgi:site-specific DNA-adenine methylase